MQKPSKEERDSASEIAMRQALEQARATYAKLRSEQFVSRLQPDVDSQYYMRKYKELRQRVEGVRVQMSRLRCTLGKGRGVQTQRNDGYCEQIEKIIRELG
jgi:hypothetical protein